MTKFPGTIDEVDLNQFHVRGVGPLRRYNYKYADVVTEVVFRGIVKEAVRFISKYDVIVGSVAWLTHPLILQAMYDRKGVSMLVQKERWIRPDKRSTGSDRWKRRLRASYNKMPSTLQYKGMPSPLTNIQSKVRTIDAVRCVGMVPKKTDGRAPLIHSKFVVGCNFLRSGTLKPTAVWTGSANFTANSERSIENAVILYHGGVAAAYMMEWAQLQALSEPLDWTHRLVTPQFAFKD